MKRALPLMITIAGLVISSGSAAASAATMQLGSSAQKPYCVAHAVPTGSFQPVVMRCFRTFAASIKAATDGLVRLPASAKSGSVTPDEINAVIDAAKSPSATYVIGIDYQNAKFKGASLTLTESSKCGSFSLSSMPSGWNDIVSSLSTSSNCASTLWQNVGFSGSTYQVGVNTKVGYVGNAFNDEASSQKWCSSYPC